MNSQCDKIEIKLLVVAVVSLSALYSKQNKILS